MSLVNGDSGAVDFLYDNRSWVMGTFFRNVDGVGNYAFPVGDYSGFHPVVISGLPEGVHGWFGDTYNSEISSRWDGLPIYLLQLSANVGWEIESSFEDGPLTMDVGLSLFDSDMNRLDYDNDMGILRSDGKYVTQVEALWDVYTFDDGRYLMGESFRPAIRRSRYFERDKEELVQYGLAITFMCTSSNESELARSKVKS